MELTRTIRRAAIYGLSAGAIALASFGLAGPAQAEEAVNPCAGTATLGSIVVEDGMGGSKVIGQQCTEQSPLSGSSNLYTPQYYQQSYQYPTFNWQYPNQYYWPYNQWGSYTSDPSIQSQMSLISNAAEVLNIPVNVVLNELSYGYSLTQIAANRGWPRSSFYTSLLNKIQADVNAGVANGSISPSYASSLYNQLASQASTAIDQPGLNSVLGYVPWQTLWGAYGYY